MDSYLNFMKFPVGHHRFIRTTNLLERTFEEQKRRTKTIPRFLMNKVVSNCLRYDDKS
ncbi:MAG: transposase [Ignavibacteria bacterium]|nr:transposase [Ignavibacteria bacterium]